MINVVKHQEGNFMHSSLALFSDLTLNFCVTSVEIEILVTIKELAFISQTVYVG